MLSPSILPYALSALVKARLVWYTGLHWMFPSLGSSSWAMVYIHLNLPGRVLVHQHHVGGELRLEPLKDPSALLRLLKMGPSSA